MTTLREIVGEAYRESGIIQIGEAISSDQLDEGLKKLYRIIKNLYGNEIGSKFVDANFGTQGLVTQEAILLDEEPVISSAFSPVDYRIHARAGSPKTIYLDPAPYNGARIQVIDSGGDFATNNLTLNGNGRSISSGASVTLDVDGSNRSWFYRADLGEWTEISDLTEDSESPFPGEYDDYLVILLAIRLHPRYLVTTASETVQHFSELRRRFRAYYDTHKFMQSESGLLNLSFSTRGRSPNFSKGIV